MALSLLFCGKHTSRYDCGVLVTVALFADAILVGALLHLFDEFVPRPNGIFLNSVLVHGFLLRRNREYDLGSRE